MNEAHYMINEYNKIYGVYPEEFPKRYIEASVYSNGFENGGNPKYLKDVPIRVYTYLDVEWLINKRRRDLYDWNGNDIVAMINDLKSMGNHAIATMGKAVQLDGKKHPHS